MVILQLLTPLTTQMKTTKKKMSMQSDFKTVSEETITEAVTTTIEVTEVEQFISTLMLTEEVSKPPNIGAIQTEEETPTEEIEEAILKRSNKQQQLKISKDRNKRNCANTAKSQDTQLKTAGLFKPKTGLRGARFRATYGTEVLFIHVY